MGTTACREFCKSHRLRKREGCDNFDTVSTGSRPDVNSLHAGRHSESRLSWCAAYCISPSSFIFVYLGILCVVRHAKSAGSSLSFHNWNVHDSVKEPDMCDFHRLLHLFKPGNSLLQHIKKIDDLVDESWRSKSAGSSS